MIINYIIGRVNSIVRAIPDSPLGLCQNNNPEAGGGLGSWADISTLNTRGNSYPPLYIAAN